jgi:hypothetical protein
MNPPFLIWEQLSATEKASVRASLGPAHRDRPDMAFAFIFRALESLAPGGVVASVVPASFLESRSAEDIRSHITHSGEFQVHLIGQFRDFGYFDATLQPAFIVVSRSEQYGPVRILVAEEKNGDEALRLLRRIPWHENAIEEGIELHNVSKHDLPVERWTPQPRQALEFIELIKENTFTTVGDFFIPRLGVRVGDRDVLLVTPDDLSKLCTTKSEKRYFRPIADRISDGRIEPTDYVFYPYGTDGALLLTTESQLREALPTFYQQRLLPAKSSLKKRGSLHHRNWWEVSEPVATWLAAHTPRIVSQEFSRAGNFAVDTTGEYAVCGGLGWCWNRGTVDLKTLLAYLAILNSEFFDKVLSCYCPRTRGKQYKVRRNFVERVPLPALDDAEVRRGLESIGRAITNGKTYDHQTREALAKKAYGVSQAGKPLKIEQNANARLERRFKDLADQWEAATGVYSRTEQKLRHPLYREIIALGSGLVPLLLKEMRDSPGHWSDALRELTGANPVPKKADTLKAIAKAWVSWGREHGHDI